MSGASQLETTREASSQHGERRTVSLPVVPVHHHVVPNESCFAVGCRYLHLADPKAQRRLQAVRVVTVSLVATHIFF